MPVKNEGSLNRMHFFSFLLLITLIKEKNLTVQKRDTGKIATTHKEQNNKAKTPKQEEKHENTRD